MEKLTKPFADYPHTRQVGGLVFLAGQGCRDPETGDYAGLTKDPEGTVIAYDISAQTLGVLTNMERALKTSGLDRRHLVDVTVFLTTMDDFEAMNECWDQFFAECPSPTRTTVAVKQLPGKNYVEMKGIAVDTDAALGTGLPDKEEFASEHFHS